MEQFGKLGRFFHTYLRQSFAALLCLIQFNICVSAMEYGTRDILPAESAMYRLGFFIGCSIFMVVIAMALVRFYDAIDDRCFLEFCEELSPINFLKRPSWLLSVVVLAFGMAFGLSTVFSKVLFWAGVRGAWIGGVCYAVGCIVVAGLRVWQIRRLYHTWTAQAEIQRLAQTEFPSKIARVGQAVLMFFAVVLLSFMGMPYGMLIIMTTLSLTASFFSIFGVVLAILLFSLLILWGVRRIRRLMERHKFLERLRSMQKRGEISFTLEGHPYLSIFTSRAYFGMRLVDKIRTKETEGPKTYLLSVVNLQKRRLTVNLRENHVGQIAHEIRLRMGPAAMMMSRHTKGQLSQPIHTFHSNFFVHFPEGEGDRILILDPAPYVLYICEGHRRAEGDNGSRVYDYTVWTKNAFANFVERT